MVAALKITSRQRKTEVACALRSSIEPEARLEFWTNCFDGGCGQWPPVKTHLFFGAGN